MPRVLHVNPRPGQDPPEDELNPGGEGCECVGRYGDPAHQPEGRFEGVRRPYARSHPSMTSPPDPFASFRLDDRVAIVTGASSGIGARLAQVLAAAGASVVLAARRLDRLEKVAAELPGSGHLAVACDMANDDDLEALVQATIDRHGQIDILVNNAGISDPQPAETEPMATFRLLMEVNLIGAFALTQRAARHMLSQGRGAIVNV